MHQKRTKNIIDIREYWYLLLRRKLYFMIPFAVTLFVGIIYSIVAQPVYQSSTVVQVSQSQLLSRQMQELVPGITAQERLNNLRRLITSHNYLKILIQSLDLVHEPQIREKAETQKDQHPGMSIEEIAELLWIDQLQNYLTISQQGTDFIQITAIGTTPDMAYNLANTLTQIFIDESLRREVGGIRGALQFSSEQVTIYKKKLEESEEALRNYKELIVNDEFDNNAVITGNLEEVNVMLSATDFELREMKDRLQFLNSRLRMQGINNNPVSTPVIAQVKTQLLAMVVELSELMLKASWQDAKVLKINAEIEILRNNLKKEIENNVQLRYPAQSASYTESIVEKEITTIDIDFLTRKKEVFSNLVRAYKGKLTRIPSREMNLSRLEREVQANRDIYQTLLQQARGSEIEEALQRTAAEFKFKTIQPAIKPLKPIKPNRLKLIFMSLVLGLSFGVGLIYFMEYIDHSFKNVEDVEKYLNLPVLGTIPKIEKEKNNKFY